MTDTPTRPRIAVLVGSLRADSINLKIARSIIALGGHRADIEIVPIADLALYSEELDASPPAEYARFRSQITAADGVIFCTPEYNRGVPGGLKNAIDVGSRPSGHNVWSGKPTVIVSASPSPIGGFGANHQLRQLCVFLDMPTMQQPEAYLGSVAAEKFDADGVVTDDALKSFLGSIVEAYMAWLARALRARRPQSSVTVSASPIGWHDQW